MRLFVVHKCIELFYDKNKSYTLKNFHMMSALLS